MKTKFKNTLRAELVSAGARQAEADELVRMSDRLRRLRDDVPKAVPAPRRSVRLRLIPLGAVAVLALLIGMSLVGVAQGSLPGSALYPVKRLSENTAVLMDPNYRATIMMRRADEVRQLIADGASSGRVTATLASYQTTAAAYKGSNYPALQYCKTSLLRAEKNANPTEHQQIAGVLKTLGDID